MLTCRNLLKVLGRMQRDVTDLPGTGKPVSLDPTTLTRKAKSMSNYCLGPYRRLTRRRLLLGAVVLVVAGGPAVSAAGLGSVVAGAAASAQETLRVCGTAYLVKAQDGSQLKLALAANAGVSTRVTSALCDFKQGSLIGVAALPHADGSQRALKVHIYHESRRATGVGHRLCDLQPNSTNDQFHSGTDRRHTGR